MTSIRRTPVGAKGRLTLGSAFLWVGLAACSDAPTDTTLETFAGEWCTFQALTSQDVPIANKVWIGLTLIEQAGQVFGTGTISAPNDDAIIPSRFAGTVTGLTALIDRSDIPQAELAGPPLTLNLTREGNRDLRGTVSGDPAFNGSIHLVRLGPRCFTP